MTEQHKCAQDISDDFGAGFRDCARHGTVFEDGKWWCKQHSPSSTRARQAASDLRRDEQTHRRHEEWERKQERERRAECFPELVAALQAWLDWNGQQMKLGPIPDRPIEQTRAALAKAENP